MKGYVVQKDSLDVKVLREMREELTVKPLSNPNFADTVEPYPVYVESKTNIYLPRFYGLAKLGVPSKGFLFPALEQRPNLTTTMTLRDYQHPIITKTLDVLNNGDGGGVLELYTGSGKTSIAIYLICQLKVKTLIIVHKSFLLQQWVDRIKQFVPGASIGVIQGTVTDVADKDIVIGMLQTLSMKEHNDTLFDDFGFTVCDECHHLSAEVFCRALQKIATKNMLGLSATPKRKDGLTKVMHWYLGPTAYRLQRDGDESQKVLVKKIVFNCDNMEYRKEFKNFKGIVSLPQMITNVAGFAPRNAVIIHEILQYIGEKGRQVMVISDRISHLIELKTILETSKKHIVTGLYTGSQKQKELQVSEKADVIFSSYAMCREGLDIQSLNTIILATSTGDVVQTCGRILRKVHDVSPLVIDIVDNFSTFAGQSKKRDTFYKKSKYHITTKIYKCGTHQLSSLDLSTVEMAKDAATNKKDAADAEADVKTEATCEFIEEEED